jgi:hypothetical protein
LVTLEYASAGRLIPSKKLHICVIIGFNFILSDTILMVHSLK